VTSRFVSFRVLAARCAMLGGLLLLTACGTSGRLAELPPLPANVTPIAAPAKDLGPYRLQIGDVIEIKFPLNPELNESVTVRPDGMISTSLAADILAYNLTVAELNKSLEKAYRSELTDPRLSAVVRSFAPTRVYVSGEVANPGEFVNVGPTLTLTQVIARAGGTLNSADDRRVVIIRRGAGEEPQVFVADYFAATQEGNAAADARLAAYDVVFVPKTGAALVFENYQQYIQQYITPSVGVSANYNLRR
jgi:polysaccharide export outer membrane protein